MSKIIWNDYEFNATPPKEISANEWFEGNLAAIRVFNIKYAMKKADGSLETPSEMIWRVCTYIASAEKTQKLAKLAAETWFDMILNKQFWPGGRICYAAGRKNKSSLINCTTFSLERDRNGNPTDPDNLESIYETAYMVGKVESRGEGVGVDVSGLRPKGHATNNCAIESTGAVSWMDLFSLTTGIIAQEGRRGALLISLDDSHPDIMEFIDVKSHNLKAIAKAKRRNLPPDIMAALNESLKIQYANISVKISDEFMQAYLNDENWLCSWPKDAVQSHRIAADTLVESTNGITTRQYSARDVMHKIANRAYLSAEPGVLFWNTSQRFSNSDAVDFPVVGVNACSEQVLSHGSSCTLSNINLADLPPDLEEATEIVYNRAKEVFKFLYATTVCQLRDNRCPTPIQAYDIDMLHRVGVGHTGLGDYLMKQGLSYDSDEAMGIAEELTKAMCCGAYKQNMETAKIYGNFKAFDWEKLKNSEFIKHLLKNKAFTEEELSQGLASVCALTLPPVGTGHMMLQSTSGIEPAFHTIYYRRTGVVPDGYREKWHWDLYIHKEVANQIKVIDGINPNDLDTDEEKFACVYKHFPPGSIRVAHDIDWRQKIKLLSRVQKWIDSSISVTYNLDGARISPEDIEELYVEVWKAGLKGCAVYVEQPENRDPILQVEKPTTFNFSDEFIKIYGDPYHYVKIGKES